MNTGYLEDKRSDKEKGKDFLHEELNFGGGAEWLTRAKALKSAKKYEKFNQLSTSSCVAHAGALALGIDNFLEGEGYIKLAPAFIYRNRVNFRGAGMYAYDLGEIGSNKGSCKYQLLPTPKTENEINALSINKEMEEDALIWRSENYVFLNNPTVTQLKNISNGMGKAIPISIFSTRDEWAREYPEVIEKNLELGNAYIRHMIAVLPNSAYEYRGKKYVIIQDSAWFGGLNIRHLSEDFIKERVRHGLYFINLPNPRPNKEKSISFRFNFYRHLQVGDRGEDVKKLQRALKDLGFFSYPELTGYFGGITRKAVIDFQEYYANEVLKFFGLAKGTGYVGRTTIAKLHKLMI